MQASRVKVDSQEVIFSDSPGFNGIESKDPEIFAKLTAWLVQLEAYDRYLNRAIWVQSIARV